MSETKQNDEKPDVLTETVGEEIMPQVFGRLFDPDHIAIGTDPGIALLGEDL